MHPARIRQHVGVARIADAREDRGNARSRALGVLLALVGLCATTSCTGERIVFGHIPPTTFQFTTVVAHDGAGPGGWQVAQVVVLLGRISTMFPRAALCNVEVGAPLVNTQQGVITVEHAQLESARAADMAARKLFQERQQPTGTLCGLFRETMAYFLASREVGTIRGARVSGFRSWPGKKVPRRTFPRKRGR